MSTRKETTEFILDSLGEPKYFSVRAMFGEYALYADPRQGGASGKVVGLICNDQLYVKIMPESAELEGICEKDEAYPGSKKFYVVPPQSGVPFAGEEVQLSKIKNLSDILLNIAKALPMPKKKVKKKTK